MSISSNASKSPSIKEISPGIQKIYENASKLLNTPDKKKLGSMKSIEKLEKQLIELKKNRNKKLSNLEEKNVEHLQKQLEEIKSKTVHSTPESIQSSMLENMLGNSNLEKQEIDISPLTNESIVQHIRTNRKTLGNKKNSKKKSLHFKLYGISSINNKKGINMQYIKKNTNHPNNKNTRRKSIPNNKVTRRNTHQRRNQRHII